MGTPLLIGISLGDVTGIGPEVTLKALCAEQSVDQTRYLLIGDARWARSLNRRLGLGLQLVPETAASDSDRLLLANLPSTLNEQASQGSADAARSSIEWVREGASRCLDGKLDGLRAAQVDQRIERRSDAAPGVEDIVDEDNVLAHDGGGHAGDIVFEKQTYAQTEILSGV